MKSSEAKACEAAGNKLAHWAHDNRKSYKEIAVMVGASQGSVGRWCLGRHRPAPVVAKRIEELTGGLITAWSWYKPAEVAA